MARIRSLHPTQWTDEQFVTLSAFARLLCLGIRNEADDQGVFEWKPITLKMRILPADNVDVSELLEEMEALGVVKRFEVRGKSYGAIRNFRKFQRPKKPNSSYPLPDEFRIYVGIDDDSSEPVGNQWGTSGEIAPQMEDVGGNSSSVDEESTGAEAPISETIEVTLFREGKAVLGRSAGGQITKLRKHAGDYARALAIIREAKTKQDPPEWVAAVLKGGPAAPVTMDDILPPDVYGGLH